jgi:hypothetical protein
MYFVKAFRHHECFVGHDGATDVEMGKRHAMSCFRRPLKRQDLDVIRRSDRVEARDHFNAEAG